MRRILVVVLLFLVASLFAFRELPIQAVPASLKVDDQLVINNEKQIVEAIRKNDATALKNLIADDGVLMGSAGIISGSGASKFLLSPDYALLSASMDDPKVTLIDKDAALLTYKTTGTETYKRQSRA